MLCGRLTGIEVAAGDHLLGRAGDDVDAG